MRNQVAVHTALVVLSIATVAAVLFLSPMEPVQADPPWRPSLTPDPTAVPPLQPTPNPTSQFVTEEKPDGALIELWAEFPSDWPWHEIHWQDLWTVVQWQNDEGEWRNVIEWQGTLDHVTIDEDGLVVGYKRWWVDQADLGKSIFRWRVYHGRAGQVLVTSDLFRLPSTKVTIRRVDVLLPIPDAMLW